MSIKEAIEFQRKAQSLIDQSIELIIEDVGGVEVEQDPFAVFCEDRILRKFSEIGLDPVSSGVDISEPVSELMMEIEEFISEKVDEVIENYVEFEQDDEEEEEDEEEVIELPKKRKKRGIRL